MAAADSHAKSRDSRFARAKANSRCQKVTHKHGANYGSASFRFGTQKGHGVLRGKKTKACEDTAVAIRQDPLAHRINVYR